ncbi:putative signal peptide protein [Puccinia sorghi]|uniref:Putative signal peptide protein n=1 Tax=Puccinia sorghi TaxID=27349 RepID=A0A0L6VF71_9BASI|nr:putative signal peptide protein [Puccinia sorghi]
MSFKDLWVSVSIVAIAMLPINPASGWSLGVGECDFNSQAKAFKLLATCKEAFGITPAPPVGPSTPPSPAPSPQPATSYTGYPYIIVPAIPQQSPSAQYYPYPYTRVLSPIDNSTGAALAAGTIIPSTGFPSPAAAVQPQAPVPAGQVSPPPTQVSAPPSQVSPPQTQAPATAGGATNGVSKPSGINTTTSTSNVPPFLSLSNATTSHAAGKAAGSSGESNFPFSYQ